MIEILLAIALFSSTIVMNYAHVKCTIATTERKRIAAANWGLITYAIGIAGWAIALTQGWWLLAFEGAGFWVGTYIGVGK